MMNQELNMSKKILVTGGCGYIGCHTVRELQRQDYEIVVFDNLVHGHLAAVENVARHCRRSAEPG